MKDEEDEELQAISIISEHCCEGESEGSTRRRGGSVINRRVINRDREEGNARLYNDYFSNNPTYPDSMFRRRFRMRRSLFLRIQEEISANDEYFTQREDAVGIRGLSPLQKITAAIRMLAYGTAADGVDDYIRIGESTAIESLRRFVKGIVEIFGAQYMRRPNNEDVARLLTVAESRGFPGMLGSIDCMHWKWKNCPTAWQGIYTGHVHEPTIILEAVASYDLWIWHAFFGLPGSLNDINVLDASFCDSLAVLFSFLAAFLPIGLSDPSSSSCSQSILRGLWKDLTAFVPLFFVVLTFFFDMFDVNFGKFLNSIQQCEKANALPCMV